MGSPFAFYFSTFNRGGHLLKRRTPPYIKPSNYRLVFTPYPVNHFSVARGSLALPPVG
jgi:hypothetical protein